MLNLKQLLILAVLVAPEILVAQQAATPLPPQVRPLPCGNSAQDTTKKIHFHVPPALQSVIDKQRAQISQKTGIDLPPVDQIIKDATQPKPCAPSAMSAPTPAAVPAPTVTPVPAPAVAPAPATTTEPN